MIKKPSLPVAPDEAPQQISFAVVAMDVNFAKQHFDVQPSPSAVSSCSACLPFWLRCPPVSPQVQSWISHAPDSITYVLWSF
jgi:hypothetical protein